MALPSFKSLAARAQERRKAQDEGHDGVESSESPSTDRPITPTAYSPGVDIKLATSTRRGAIITACLFFLISVVFLILTEIGNISKKAVIRDTYFFKLNLSNIIPASTPGDIVFVNSLARSLGLYDFYQVGLWSFCQGYTGEGVVNCSKPKALYWFNPVEILLNELLAGASVALPAEINNILRLIRLASHFMFGFFLTGVCMNFVSIFITPVALLSRWWSFPIVIWTFIAALLTTAGAVIGTVMSVIFRNVLTSQAGLNIGASLGIKMFAFMWVGSAFSIFGFLIHLGLSCCCASKRDVRTGRRMGNKKAYEDGVTDEKGSRGFKRRIPFGRRKSASGAA